MKTQLDTKSPLLDQAGVEGAATVNNTEVVQVSTGQAQPIDGGASKATWNEYGKKASDEEPPGAQLGSLALTHRRHGKKGGSSALQKVMLSVATGASVVAAFSGASNAAFAADIATPAAQATAAVNHAASSKAFHAANVRDVVSNWQQHQHVYVVGDSIRAGQTPVSNQQLDALERWADVNAPNATIVLMQNASRDGGLQNAKRTLGDGISNSSTFGNIKDERSGERTGLVMIVSLDDKNHDIKAGDGLDRRGLGEESYTGKLDAPFIAAMRGGDGLVVAVQNTIQNINTQYQKSVTSEIAARETQLNQAKGSIQSSAGTVALLEQKAQAFRAANGGVTGDLARPELTKMRTDLANAQSLLQQGNPSAARALADQVQQRASNHMKALDAFAEAPRTFASIQKTIDDAASHEYAAAAQTQLADARKSLESAKAEHRAGDSSYAPQMKAARSQADAALEAAKSAERSANLQHGLELALALALFAAGAGLGFVKNRKAREKGKEAQELLKRWEAALHEKHSQALKLRDDAKLAIGGNAEAALQRFEGESRQLALSLIKDVDQMRLMLGATEGVFDRAEELMGKRLANLFSTKNYEEAINVLRDQPIEWKPEDGLAAALGKRSDKEMLSGSLESYDPFKMSFKEMMDGTTPGREGFNVRAARAYDSLQQIQNNQVASVEQLAAIQKDIERLGGLAKELGTGLFSVPAATSQLLAAAQASQAQAAKDSGRDPVGAMKTSGSDAMRRSKDAELLIELAADGRAVAERAQAAAAALTEGGVNAKWIGAEITRLSERANELASVAVKDPIASELQALRAQIDALDQRTKDAVALDARRRGAVQKGIDDGANLVADARQTLGAAIKKDAQSILREKGADPSDRLKGAADQSSAAKAALDRGDVAAAAGALDEAQRLTLEAAAIVEQSRTAHAEFAGTHATRSKEINSLEGQVPAHEKILDAIRKGYAPSVLQLSAGDAAHPNGNGTVADNLEEIAKALSDAKGAVSRAEQSEGSGRFLEGAELLAQAQGLFALGTHRLQEIAEKQSRLTATVQANSKLLGELEGRVKQLVPVVDDARTQKATIDAFRQAQNQLGAARGALEQAKADPFAGAGQLAQVQAAIERVAVMANNDRDIHAEAARSLKAAEEQLATAQRLVRESANDGVTDSSAIEQARAAVEKLAGELQGVAPRISTSHGDWPALDQTADRITGDLAKAGATLRDELSAAEKATSAISSASSNVSSASSWVGSYGVTIFGSPGSSELQRARSALSSGNYAGAVDLADRAGREARSAVSDAESEVRSRQLAEQRRQEQERREREEAEEERRRAAARSSSYSSSDSGGFGGGSSFSSSSTGGFSSGGGSSW
ncbi:MAG: hypothetical protein IT384_31640 [Deltaproteobacteria bacterium]|nr:hypothetical protein [Deltaproteobacteria bacterium]